MMVGNVTFLGPNDFCGFCSVAVNTMNKLRFLVFIIISVCFYTIALQPTDCVDL